MGYTEVGLAAGKRNIEYHGESRVVLTELNIGDYEAGGVAIELLDFAGVSRLSNVQVDVVDSTQQIARYDYNNGTIRIFNLSDGSEPSGGTTLDLNIRLRVEGRG